MEDLGHCLFTPKLSELQLFQVEKSILNEGQNRNEQSLLTAKPLAPSTLEGSSDNNMSLTLRDKNWLLAAPGGSLRAGISPTNLLQDSLSLLKITLLVHT